MRDGSEQKRTSFRRHGTRKLLMARYPENNEYMDTGWDGMGPRE